MMRMKKLIIQGLSAILFFSCFSSANAAEKDRVTMATKMLALCYQAKNLYMDFEKFVLPKKETYISLSSLYGAVSQTECFGFVLETPSKIFIVFRGSASYGDIFKDFMIKKTPFIHIPNGGNVHTGFFSIYNNTCKDQPESLRDQILRTLENISPEKQLVITGFSLGGALATLCACDVAENSRFKDPIVYTFASPRVGDQLFVNAYNNRISRSVRVINYHDYVPCNPLQWLGYRHVKGEVILKVSTGRIDSNHKLDSAYFPGLAANVPEYKEKLMQKYPGLCPPLPQTLPNPSWEERQEMNEEELPVEDRLGIEIGGE